MLGDFYSTLLLHILTPCPAGERWSGRVHCKGSTARRLYQHAGQKGLCGLLGVSSPSRRLYVWPVLPRTTQAKEVLAFGAVKSRTARAARALALCTHANAYHSDVGSFVGLSRTRLHKSREYLPFFAPVSVYITPTLYAKINGGFCMQHSDVYKIKLGCLR